MAISECYHIEDYVVRFAKQLWIDSAIANNAERADEVTNLLKACAAGAKTTEEAAHALIDLSTRNETPAAWVPNVSECNVRYARKLYAQFKAASNEDHINKLDSIITACLAADITNDTAARMLIKLSMWDEMIASERWTELLNRRDQIRARIAHEKQLKQP